MAYSHADGAVGSVAAPRPPGGASLVLAAGKGAAFAAGSPSPSSPTPVTVFRGDPPVKVGTLLVTGVSGDALTVAGAVPGSADFAVVVGDVAACVPIAFDFDSLWNAIGDVETTPGPPGTAATLAVGSVTTGSPGSAASVVNSGTASAAVFDITIPRGATGADGAAGAKGDQGAKGDKGDAGAKGDQGIQGIQGIQGAKGDTGASGSAGAKGDKGDTGAAGVGVPAGGTTGQVLSKSSGTDYATAWTTPAGGGGGVSFPLVDGSSQSSGSADQWSFKDTSGAVAAAVDKDGNEGSYETVFVLARGVDLTAGSGLVSSWASAPGKILDIQIKAEVNGSSGGFTLAVKKNGTAIASQTVAASSTSLVTIAAGSISSLPIAKGDVFSIDASSVGVGVQSVRVAIRHARRNR